MTEDELYSRFLAGDTASYDELMIRLGDRLIVYINAYLHDWHDSEDMMIEAFARIFALAVRGFGTGAMHIVCGCITALGIALLRDRKWIRTAGSLALLTVAATFHGSYNILVSQTGIAAYIGYAIPLVSAVTILLAVNRKKELFSDKK